MKRGQTDRRDAVVQWLRRCGRKIMQHVALAVLVLICVVRRILPPSIRSIDRQWKRQERRRMECHAPDPTSSLVLASPGPLQGSAGAVSESSSGRKKTVAPSKIKLLRRMRQTWVLRMILVCMVLSAVCLGALMLCSRVRVTSVQCRGMDRYSAEELTAVAGVQPGDEWLGVDTQRAKASLLAAFPYLQSVSVTRAGRGNIRIDVTERVPAFAVITDNGAVLLDASLYALEIRTDGIIPAGLCLLENIPVTQDAAVKVGAMFPLPERLAAWLCDFVSAADLLPSEAVRLDAADSYALMLYLSDGTRIYIGDTKDAVRKLSTASEALKRSLASTSEDADDGTSWMVNVSDPTRVTVGKVTDFDR